MAMNRWLPVSGGILMNLAMGSLYAWSTFVLPLEAALGLTRVGTSWGYTIAVICFSLSFLFAGRLQDQRGPKICALIGGLLVSAGFLLASTTRTLTNFYLFFGVVVGVGNGFGYATLTPVASKWFPDKHRLVGGLMIGGYCAGSAVFGSLAERWLVPNLGWRTTLQIFGVVFLVMAMAGTLLLKNPPVGYRPPNWTPPTPAAAARSEYSTGEMLATPRFYFLWIACCFGTTAGQMIISQLSPFARGAGIFAPLAIFTISALGDVGGRTLSGLMSDPLGRLRTLKVMVLFSSVAMPALSVWRQQEVLFFVLLATVYLCYGAQLSLFASTTADFFGTKNLEMNYGVLFTAWGAAGIIGPAIAAREYVLFGDYRYSFFAAAGLAVVAFVALSMAEPLAREAGA